MKRIFDRYFSQFLSLCKPSNKNDNNNNDHSKKSAHKKKKATGRVDKDDDRKDDKLVLVIATNPGNLKDIQASLSSSESKKEDGDLIKSISKVTVKKVKEFMLQ